MRGLTRALTRRLTRAGPLVRGTTGALGRVSRCPVAQDLGQPLAQLPPRGNFLRQGGRQACRALSQRLADGRPWRQARRQGGQLARQLAGQLLTSSTSAIVRRPSERESVRASERARRARPFTENFLPFRYGRRCDVGRIVFPGTTQHHGRTVARLPGRRHRRRRADRGQLARTVPRRLPSAVRREQSCPSGSTRTSTPARPGQRDPQRPRSAAWLARSPTTGGRRARSSPRRPAGRCLGPGHRRHPG
jgi:hypothetical protein